MSHAHRLSVSTRRWVFGLVVASVLACGAGPARGEEKVQRFQEVKEWRLRVTWGASLTQSETWDVAGSATIDKTTLNGVLAGRVDFKLVKSRDSNKAYYQWETEEGIKPLGGLNYRAENYRHSRNKETGKESWFKLAADAGGVEEGEARLTIDAKSGTLQVYGYATTSKGNYVQSGSAGGEGQSEFGLSLSTGMGEWQEPLPASGLKIVSAKHQELCLVPLILGGRMMEVSWVLEPWKKEEPPEVSVEPVENYDSWVPIGNLDDYRQPGNRLRFEVRVHQPGQPDQPAEVGARIQFSLPEISGEKGVCMNWPPNGLVQKTDGLQILADENPALEVRDAAFAETAAPVTGIQMVVSCFDYGAWGKLRVTAQDENGHELKVKIRGQAGGELMIPRDDNRNHIADVWEKEKGVAGQPGDADGENRPAGQKSTGDGLTLYEEYRGFSVKGQHFSADPQRKDLFVCDQTGRQIAGPGIDRFEAVSGLNVWQVTAEELGDDRVINRNHLSAPHKVDQHGLRIKDAPEGEHDPAAVPVDPNVDAFGPPRLTAYVQLLAKVDYGSAAGIMDVVHELGHAVGLPHHADGAIKGVLWQWRQNAEGQWQLYETTLDMNSPTFAPKGAATPIKVFYEPREGEAAPRPLRYEDGLPLSGIIWSPKLQGWRLQIYTQGGEFSGDVECYMRYEDKQAFFKLGDAVNRYLVDASQNRPRTRFCTTTVGNYVNEKGHRPCSRGGDAPDGGGKCFEKIVIDDSDANN